MSNDQPKLTPEETAELAEVLVDVRRATAMRPPAERDAYERAQDSVVEARRVAEARAGSLRIIR